MPTLLTRNRLILNQPQGRYLLNDDFTFDLPAGALAGSFAYPGPGRRVFVRDTGARMSISGGAVTIANSVNTGDPGIWFDQLNRRAGVVLIGVLTPTASSMELGWDNDNASGVRDGFRLSSSLTLRVDGGTLVVGATVLSTAYTVAVIMRATGIMWLIKGGAFTSWTLLWISATFSYAPYPAIASGGAATSATVDAIRWINPSLAWLPAPLASDGFGSTFGTTDGLGHAEGAEGGIGSGGSGVAYTTVGTWVNSGGIATTSALSGGFALAYTTLATADVVITTKVTRAGGDAGLVLRFTDTSNHITCHHNGTNVILLKKVAGTGTTVQSTAATYVAGAELRVVAEATKFRVYYNNALVGSEQTIADAALQSPQNVGLYTTNTGNQFDDLVIWARGTGGEYAALDAF